MHMENPVAPSEPDAESVDAESVDAGAERSLRRRQRLAVAFVVVGSLLMPVAVLAVWVRSHMLETDRWVETMDPLATDPVIVSALSERVSGQVSDTLDVRSRAAEVLPPEASFLAAPIAAGADRLVAESTDRLLTSEQFAELWASSSRAAHGALVAALTGREGDVVSTAGGRVVLDLDSIAERVLERVDDQLGIDVAARVPTDRADVELVLVDSKQLTGAQVAVRWLDRLSWLLVVLSFGALVVALVVGPDRRRVVLGVGIGAAVAMVVLGVGLGVVRDVYLVTLPEGVERPDAAAAVFDIVTRFLLQAVRMLAAVGVVLAVAAWLAGPATAAVRVRSWWAHALGRGGAAAGSAVDLGPVPAWFAGNLGAVRAAILAAGAAVLVVWPRPTAKAVLAVALVVLVPLAVAQLLAAAERRPGHRHHTGDR